MSLTFAIILVGVLKNYTAAAFYKGDILQPLPAKVPAGFNTPTVGGLVMANEGDKWFYLEWLAKRYGRTDDIIRLRPRLVGESITQPHRLNITGDARLPFTTRARFLVDTAAALNPKDEKSFFKVKGASHISRAVELLSGFLVSVPKVLLRRINSPEVAPQSNTTCTGSIRARSGPVQRH